MQIFGTEIRNMNTGKIVLVGLACALLAGCAGLGELDTSDDPIPPAPPAPFDDNGPALSQSNSQSR